MNQAKKPHVSPSQLESLSRCGEAYRRRYVEGEKVPPGIAAIIGSGVHGGAAVNFEQKIFSGVDLKPNDIADAAVAAYDARLDGGVMLTADEMSIGKNKVFGRARDQTRRMAEFHAKVVAPEYQPIAVERPIRLELPRASHDLLGVLDVVVEGDQLVDFKTSGKRKPDSDAHVSVQLTAYAVLFRKEYGKLPTSLRLDYAIRGTAIFTRVVVDTTRGPREIEAFAARLGAFTRIVKAGVFAPADPRSWFCSPKWCGYYSTCPFVQGGSTAQGD